MECAASFAKDTSVQLHIGSTAIANSISAASLKEN